MKKVASEIKIVFSIFMKYDSTEKCCHMKSFGVNFSVHEWRENEQKHWFPVKQFLSNEIENKANFKRELAI